MIAEILEFIRLRSPSIYDYEGMPSSAVLNSVIRSAYDIAVYRSEELGIRKPFPPYIVCTGDTIDPGQLQQWVYDYLNWGRDQTIK